MITAVKNYLKQNVPFSCSVFEYGDSLDRPSVPYAVVKGESNSDGVGVRVILHMNPGEQTDLRNNLRMIVSVLQDAEITSENGNLNRLSRLQGYTDVAPQSDDGTISMEALFLMPTTSF